MIQRLTATLFALSLTVTQPTPPVRSVGGCPAGTYPAVVAAPLVVTQEGGRIEVSRDVQIECEEVES